MIRLEAGDYSAVVSPDLGSNVVQLTYRGRELFWCPPDEAVRQSRPQLAGAAVLFPPDRVKHGKFSFEGRDYRFPLNFGTHHVHGSAKNSPWVLEEVCPGPAQATCSTSLDSRECPGYEQFPHAFRLNLDVVVTHQGVRLRWSVANHSPQTMPWTLGIHFNLAVDPSHQTRLQMPMKDHWKLDGQGFIETPVQSRPLPPWIDVIGPLKVHGPLDQSLTRPVVLSDETTGQWTRLSLDGSWSHGTLWNGSGQEGFLSVEPLTGPIDAGNLGCPRILAPYTFWRGGVFVTAGDKENVL